MRGDVFVCGDRLEPREDGFGCLGVWEGGFGYLEPREGAEREAAAAALRHVCSRGRLGRACVVVGRRLRLGDRAGVRRGEESREVDLSQTGVGAMTRRKAVERRGGVVRRWPAERATSAPSRS